jgi:hypothetical protein
MIGNIQSKLVGINDWIEKQVHISQLIQQLQLFWNLGKVICVFKNK